MEKNIREKNPKQPTEVPARSIAGALRVRASPDPTGRCCRALGRASAFQGEERPRQGFAGFALSPACHGFFALRLEKPAAPLWKRNPPGDLQREAAQSHLRHGVGWRGKAAGGRPTTIKCDKCHICKSCGNDLKLSGTAQLSIILKLLLLLGQISISSLSLFWQDLDYLMPRRCILSPRRSWGAGAAALSCTATGIREGFFGSFKA